MVKGQKQVQHIPSESNRPTDFHAGLDAAHDLRPRPLTTSGEPWAESLDDSGREIKSITCLSFRR
jgi:hypothetical protein